VRRLSLEAVYGYGNERRDRRRGPRAGCDEMGREQGWSEASKVTQEQGVEEARWSHGQVLAQSGAREIEMRGGEDGAR